MSVRSRLFAAMYDRMSASSEVAGLRDLRRGLLAQAEGRVLEIGAGTGANLALYPAGLSSLTLTEPERPMLSRLEQRAEREAPGALILRAPAEDLPFDDGSFDTAVSTLVLCGVDDQPRALRELRRVLRPGGRLLFLEHVRSAEPSVARLQDRLNGVNRFLVGCECNRPTLSSLEAAGFTVGELRHTVLPKAPRFTSPAIVGSAMTPL